MKKIIIINKVIIGIRPYPFGYDGLNISFLKKSLSSKLQDKLNEYITILGIIKVLGIFDKKGSDDNV